jgi:2-oxoglutarate ferredoxin oxidoreductase subunit alpha
MTEALSFAIQAEIPIVVAFSQRAGPSTGTPTFHEAGDINFALNPTFGDFNHVVMTPSSLEEAYYYGCLALNIAQKYQSVVIVLLDKQSSEFHGTIESEVIPEVDRGKLEKNPKPDYARYAFSDDNISPYTTVGTKDGDFIVTSYEHDEYGATTEESEMKMKMNIKRFHKLDNFFEKEGYRGYEVINPDAKKMFICNSFTSYNAKEFIKYNSEYGLIIIKFLKPLDEKLTDEVTGKDEIIFLESNYSGQMEKYICNEFGWRFIDGLKISHKRKHDLYPFYMEDFDEYKTK